MTEPRLLAINLRSLEATTSESGCTGVSLYFG